jgi:K+-sensing histidine kinase KdpD
MSGIDFNQPRRRTTVRRTEDRLLRKQVDHYIQLFHIGQFITSEINFDTLFDVIAEQTNQIMNTERCSVFLVDEKGAELTAFVSTDLKKNEIKIPCNQGVAGWVYCNKLPLNVPDVYTDSRFYPGIDQLTGFKTKNILCVPLVNRKEECIGTLQALNKKSGDFTDDDRELLSYLSNYVTVALENAKLYEEIKAADEAKERVINHLSHELKTPLSIISAAFAIIEQKARHFDNMSIKRAAQRGRRSVSRLMDLQEKVDDIVKQRPVEENIRILSFIEDTFNIMEELDEGNKKRYEKVLGLVKNRIESIFAFEEQQIERLQIDEILYEILGKKPPSNQRDYPEIISKIKKGLFISIDRNVLKKVLEGLLKNAVENTPDEGRIEISAAEFDNGVRVEFRDYGIGITSENQKNIFGGFFHTHDTDFYSSKHPYDFYAGGAGLDLLRIKVFSEIFGFSVNLESTRCKFIALDTDLCQGKISECPYIKERADCLSSGGSIFSIDFKQVSQAPLTRSSPGSINPIPGWLH